MQSSTQAWGMEVGGWDYRGVDGLAFVALPLWGDSIGAAFVGYYHRPRLLELPQA